MVRDSNNPEDTNNRRLCRLSQGAPRTGLDLYSNNSHSLSDSELDKSSNMTAEFLDLPRRLSERSTSPLLYCLDPEKLRFDIKADRKNKLCNTGARERSNTEPCRNQVSNIEVIVDNIDEDSSQVSDVYLDNYRSYGEEEFMPRGSGVWINLEPQNHTLLSPRSSNGSICSIRSSNADSAIEMLTPDDELPEQPLVDTSAADYSKLWETRHRIHSEDLHIPGSYFEGAKSSCDKPNKVSTSLLPSVPTQCSRPFYSDPRLCSVSSATINPSSVTQQIKAISSGENTQEEQTAISTPSVVISDFSCKSELDKASQTAQTDKAEDYNSDLLGDRVHYNRSLSSSSISSESSLSMFSDSSDVADLTDFPIKLKPKVSILLTNFKGDKDKATKL